VGDEDKNKVDKMVMSSMSSCVIRGEEEQKGAIVKGKCIHLQNHLYTASNLKLPVQHACIDIEYIAPVVGRTCST
jgi:hypothetical protein